MKWEAGPDPRPWCRRWFPEPFWWTLPGLFGLSLLGAIPPLLIVALVWPNERSDWPSLACYLAAIPLTWWVLRTVDRRKWFG